MAPWDFRLSLPSLCLTVWSPEGRAAWSGTCPGPSVTLKHQTGEPFAGGFFQDHQEEDSICAAGLEVEAGSC